MKSVHVRLFSAALIVCLGIIVYSNTFHCSFHFDDESSITSNFTIRDLSNLSNIWDFWPGRFITYLSFAFNYHVNGLDVFGYHIFNLAVHLLAAICVWWLVLLTFSTPQMSPPVAVKRNLKQVPKPSMEADLIAVFAALIFVAHPLQTQAVTYIVQRAASMAALFYMASLCFYVKARLLQEKHSRPFVRRSYYFCSLLTAVLAMFTKEISVTLPLMVLFYEFYFFKDDKRFKSGYFIVFSSMLLVIPLTMLLTNSVDLGQMHRAAEEVPGISPWHYLLTQFRVMLTYLRLVFLPVNQNLDYDYPVAHSLLEPAVAASLLLLMVIFMWAKFLFSRNKLVSFSILWFFLTLLPESSLIPIKDVIYEHRLYLPMAGFSIFLAAGLYYFFQKNAIRTGTVLIIFIICNSILAYDRNKVWKDDLTLWNDTEQKSPHKSRPHCHLGTAYYLQGDLGKALAEYDKAIELDPRDVQPLNNRANIYALKKDFSLAAADFTKVISMTPRFAAAHYNRGLVFSIQGKYVQAIADYNQAITLDPNYADAYNNRAIACYQLKEYNDAWGDVQKAQALGYDVNPAFINVIKLAQQH